MFSFSVESYLCCEAEEFIMQGYPELYKLTSLWHFPFLWCQNCPCLQIFYSICPLCKHISHFTTSCFNISIFSGFSHFWSHYKSLVPLEIYMVTIEICLVTFEKYMLDRWNGVYNRFFLFSIQVYLASLPSGDFVPIDILEEHFNITKRRRIFSQLEFPFVILLLVSSWTWNLK